MKLLLTISLRNLFRQKRRNILLGIAISLGVTILLMAGSFSRGVSDIMFNKIVTYVAGHVSVNMNEGFGKRSPIFRDRERLFKIIKDNSDSVTEINEGIGVFVRAIGNGKSDNMVLVGVDTTQTLTEEQRKEYDESFHMLEGRFEDLGTSPAENALIISKEKAEALNVRMNDNVSIRFRNVFGQNQTARLTVTGILSNDNIFMQGVMFCGLKNVKAMMGYKPHETANIQLTLKDPQKNAARVADRIHRALTPGPAFIHGQANTGSGAEDVTLLPFRGDDESIKLIKSSFRLERGRIDDAVMRDGVLLSSTLARALKAGIGSEIYIKYKPKFENDYASFKIKVKGIFTPDKNTGSAVIYTHEALFYPKFYDHLPDLTISAEEAFIPSPDVQPGMALGSEWELLKRTQNSDEMRKKWAEEARKKNRATTIDVNSMYEMASDVLKLESVLNIITFAAVLILFFIILIGVVNTLRMTIKERTREIGTIRAIGMQKRDVWGIFMLEASLLSFFASIAGTILGFIFMGLLTLVKFNVTDNPLGILLVNRHLHFVPTFTGVLFNIALILLITMITAFFPARRAANMTSAEALRHYE